MNFTKCLSIALAVLCLNSIVQAQSSFELLSANSSEPNELNIYSIGESVIGHIQFQDVYLTHGFHAIVSPNIVESNNDIQNEEFTMYPNPTSDYLLIDGPFIADCSISIYNSVGQKIIINEEAVIGNQIDVNVLTPGMYYLRVQSKNSNNQLYKFIKL